MVGYMDERLNGQTHMDAFMMSGCMDGWIGEWVVVCMYRCMYVCMYGWVGE